MQCTAHQNEMKTPMQELIEQLNNVKPQDFCSIETIKVWAESLLDKEKEVMCRIYDDAVSEFDPTYIGQEKYGEQYYNETFKSVPQENNVVCSECGSEYEVQISVEHNWKMYCNNCCPVRNAKTTI